MAPLLTRNTAGLGNRRTALLGHTTLAGWMLTPAVVLLTAGLFHAFTSLNLPVHFASAPCIVAAGTALLAGVLLRKL